MSDSLNIDFNGGEAFAGKVAVARNALEELTHAINKLANAPVDKLRQQMSEINSSISSATQSLQGLAEKLNTTIQTTLGASAQKARTQARKVSEAVGEGIEEGTAASNRRIAAALKSNQFLLQKSYDEMLKAGRKFSAESINTYASQGVKLDPQHQTFLDRRLAAEQANGDAIVRVRKETAAKVSAIDAMSAASQITATVAPVAGISAPAGAVSAQSALAAASATAAAMEGEAVKSNARMKSLAQQSIAEVNRIYNEQLKAGAVFRGEELQALRTSGVSLSSEHKTQLAEFRRDRLEAYRLENAASKAAGDDRVRVEKDVANKVLAERKRITDGIIADARFQAQNQGLTGLPAQASVIRSAVRQGVRPDELSSGFSAAQIADSLAGQTAAEKHRESLAALAAEKKRNSLAAAELTAQHKRMTAGMNEAHSAARGLASGFGAMWLTYGQILPLLAGAAISNGAVQAVKLGTAVGQQLGLIQTLGGATEKQIDSLNERMLELARTGPQGPLEIATALKTLSLAGLDAAEQLSAIKPVLNFSIAGGVTAEKAAETLVAVGTAYGYTAKQFDVVGDLIAKTAASSMASVSDMSEAFKVSSVVAQQYGVSLRDMGVALGLLSQIGIKGTAAGTAAKNMVTELVGHTKKGVETLKALGIEAFDNTTKSIKPFKQLFKELGAEIQKGVPLDQIRRLQDIANERGMKGISAFLEGMRDKLAQSKDGVVNLGSALDKLERQIEEAPGFMAIAALNLGQTTENQFKGVAASFQAAMVQAFQGIEPAIQTFTAQLRGIFNSPEFVGGVKNLMSSIANVGSTLIEHKDAILEIVKAMVAWKLVTIGAGIAEALVVGLTAATAKAVALGASLRALKVEAAGAGIAAAGVGAAGGAAAAGAGVAAAGAGAAVGAATAGAAAKGLETAVTGASKAMTIFTGVLSVVGKLLPFVGAAIGILTAGWLIYEDKTIKTSAGSAEAVRLKADLILKALDEEISKLKEENRRMADGMDQAEAAAAAQEDIALRTIRAVNAEAVSAANAALQFRALYRAKREGELEGNIARLEPLPKGVYPLRDKALQGFKDELGAVRKEGAQLQDAVTNVITEGDQREAKFFAGMANLRKESRTRRELVEKGLKADRENRESGNATLPGAAGSKGAKVPDSELARLKELKKEAELVNTQLLLQQDALNELKEDSAMREKRRLEEIKDEQTAAHVLRMSQINQQQIKLAEATRPNLNAGPVGVPMPRVEIEERATALNAIAALERQMVTDQIEGINLVAEARRAEMEARLIVEEQLYAAGEAAIREKIALAEKAVKVAEGYAQRRGIEPENTTQYEEARGELAKLNVELQRYEFQNKELKKIKYELGELDRSQARDVKAAHTLAMQGYDQQILAAKQAASSSTEELNNRGKSAVAIAFETLEVNKLRLAKAQAALAGSKETGEALERQKKEVETAKALVESSSTIAINKALDASKITSFADTFKGAFGAIGTSVGGLIDKVKEFSQEQQNMAATSQAAWEKYADAKVEAAESGDPGKVEKAAKAEGVYIQQIQKVKEKSFQNDMNMYSAVAKTAQGFFKEGSKGYKAMEIASNAFALAASINAFLVGQANAAAGVAGQAQGDPYSAFPRMAAMAAAMVALGYNIANFSGGGARNPDQTRIDRQAATGTGTILGDDKEKSKSIANSLELLEGSARIELVYQSKMLTALKAIESGIGGLASAIYRTTGLTTGKGLGIQTGTISRANMPGPMTLGEMLGLTGLWGSVKRDITDLGLVIRGTIGSLSTTGGAREGIQQYADVTTTTSSWFGLVKRSSSAQQLSGISEELGREFSLVFSSISQVLFTAGKRLGKDAEWLEMYIRTSIVNIPELSLKGLKGQELQEALSAAVSSLSDTTANYLFPEIREFQRVGEGMFQTLIRVSAGIESGGASLDRFGITAIRWQDVVNKTGDIGAEIFRESAIQSQTFGTVISNVGLIMEDVQGTAEDLAASYRQLIDVQARVSVLGFNQDTLSTTAMRGAGGLDNLQSGLESYSQNFVGPARQMQMETEMLGREFSRFGQTMPTTRAGFIQLINGIDTTTEAGKLLFGQMIVLSGSMDSVFDKAEALDKAMKAMPFAALRDLSAEARDGLIDLAGSIGDLSGKISSYYQNYYSEAERTVLNSERLSRGFAALNVTMPTTRAGFRTLVEEAERGLKTGGPAARAYYMGLLEIQQLFFDTVPAAEALTTAITSTIMSFTSAAGTVRNSGGMTTAGEMADAYTLAVVNAAETTNRFTEAIRGLPLDTLANLSQEVRDRLIQAAGGMDKFATSMRSYIDKFRSAQTGAGENAEAMANKFRALGIEMPRTRQAFAALMDGTMAQIGTVITSTESRADYLRRIGLDLNGAPDPMADRTYTHYDASQGEAAQRLSAQLLDLVDEFDKFIAEAEKAAEEMTKLQKALDALPFKYLRDLAPAARDALIGLAGGIDSFTTKVNSYYENFSTEPEKTARKLEVLTKGLADLGFQMPTTRDGFRALVEGAAQTLETEGGRRVYSALLDLNQQFADLVPAVGEAENAMSKLKRLLLQLPFTYLADLAPAARDALIKLAGGIESFTEKVEGFYNNFFTDAEKTAIGTAAMTAELAALGQQMPATRAAFRAMVEDAARTLETEAGRSLYNSLIGLSQRFADLVPAAEAASEAIRNTIMTFTNADGSTVSTGGFMGNAGDMAEAYMDRLDKERQAAEEKKKALEDAVDASMAALQKAVDAQKKLLDVQVKVAQESVTNLTGIFDVLKAGVDSLASTTSEQKQAQAREATAFIDQALATAQATGYLPEKDALQKAIEAAKGGLDPNKFASSVDMERVRGVLAGKLEALRDIASSQLTPAQAALKSAEDQVKVLDDLVAKTQEAVDVFKNINAGIGSVADAVTAVYKAIEAAKAGSPANAPVAAAQAAAIQQALDAQAAVIAQEIRDSAVGMVGYVDPGESEPTLPTVQQSYDLTGGTSVPSQWMSTFDNAFTIPMQTTADAISFSNAQVVEQLAAVQTQLVILNLTSQNTANSTAQTAEYLDGATQGGGPMQSIVIS